MQAALNRSLLNKVPVEVRTTMESIIAPGGRVIEVQHTNNHGFPAYEIETVTKGEERFYMVGADGSLLYRQTFFKELSDVVRNTIQGETKDATELQTFWMNEEGDPAFYVEYKQYAQTRSIIVALDGTLLAREVFHTEIPAPVQRAIQENLKGRIPKRIEYAEESGDITFEVTDWLHGRARLWIFRADGTVAAQPLDLLDIPIMARERLRQAAVGGRLIRFLTYSFEQKTCYEITCIRGQARYVCTVDATGELLGEEVPFSELPTLLKAQIQKATQTGSIVRIERHPIGKGYGYEVFWRKNKKVEILSLTDLDIAPVNGNRKLELRNTPTKAENIYPEFRGWRGTGEKKRTAS